MGRRRKSKEDFFLRAKDDALNESSVNDEPKLDNTTPLLLSMYVVVYYARSPHR